jgi:hypothetical protein
MDIFKGDTLLKTIESDELFSVGDKLEIKIYEDGNDNLYYNNVIVVNMETNTIDLEIKASITKLFPCKTITMQIKLISISGYVKTNMYQLRVKGCK